MEKVLINYAQTNKPDLWISSKDKNIQICSYLGTETGGYGFYYFENNSEETTLIESMLFTEYEGLKFYYPQDPQS